MLILSNTWSPSVEKCKHPLVTIVVLNYNGAKFIKNCINSLQSIDYTNYEIVLVDNNSTDNSISIIKKEFLREKKIQIIESKENLGYTQGNNLGAQLASSNSEFLCFLNIDIEVTQNFLDPLIDLMQKIPSIGAIQPKILLMTDRNRIDSMGAVMDTVGMAQNIGDHELDRGQFSGMYVSYAKGAVLIVRKHLFEQLDGFDKDFFLLRDEVDLCWRIWLNGYTVYSTPISKIYHYGSAIIKKEYNNPKMTYFFIRNNIAMLLKNYSVVNVLKFLPLFLCYYGPYSFYCFVKTKKIDYIKHLLLAVSWNIIHLNITIRKRQQVQVNIRKIRDKDLFGNVIKKIPYFIDGLKKVANSCF